MDIEPSNEYKISNNLTNNQLIGLYEAIEKLEDKEPKTSRIRQQIAQLKFEVRQ